jgi:YbbR domain-containing protein
VGLLRWLGRNLGNLLLAFVLAVVVWVSAIVAADPSEETLYPRPLTLEIVNQDTSMLQLNSIPAQARLTLNAPRSILNRLAEDPEQLMTWIDLSGLGPGEHTVPVKAQVLLNPVRIISIEPKEVQVRLERLASRTFPVQVTVTGTPASGYRQGTPVIEPRQVTVSGPESQVELVASVAGSLDIDGANTNIRQGIPLQAHDQTGNPIQGVEIVPQTVSVTEPINLLGGYRNVVVKVVTSGEPADGYWLTNISVNPPNVTLFSTNPQRVNELPGYVETNPIDLTTLQDDVDVRAELVLPESVSQVGEGSVLVRLSIAAREGTLPITLPIEFVGLTPEMEVIASPETVDLLLAGPLPILNNLRPAEIRVVTNLSGLEPGIYQVEPVVDLLPNQVEVVSILPETVVIAISPAPTATPTPTGGTPTPPALTGTPPGLTPSLTASATPTP